MPDNKNKKDYRDRGRIDPSDSNEVQFAAKTWGCTTKDVIDAIKYVGTSRKKVHAYLKKEGIVS